MRTNEWASQERGFTFIEVIIAVSILAVIAVSAAMLLNRSLEQKSYLDERQQRFDALAEGVRIIRNDFEQAIPRYYRDAAGERKEPFLISEAGTSVTFIRAGHMPFPDQKVPVTLEKIQYLYDSGNLIRRSALALDTADQNHWQEAIVLSDVRTLSFSFFHAGGWQRSWYTQTVADASLLPEAMALQLNYPPYEQIEIKVLMPGYSDG